MTNERVPITENCKITVWSWKDERWSADKETLDAINKAIRMNRYQDKYLYARRRNILADIFNTILRRGIYLAKQIGNLNRLYKKQDRR